MNCTSHLVFSCIALEAASPIASANNEQHGAIDHKAHPHHLSVIVGNTDLDNEGSGFTLGIDYEYRVNDVLGLGVVAEYARGDLEAWTYLLVADIHITNQWILQIGPGTEYTDKHDLFVARFGTLYEFEFEGGWTLAPQIHYDYHDGGDDAIVYGVALGMAF